MEEIELNLNELTPQELALAEIEDNKTKLTWSQRRAMKVESMMDTKTDKETGEEYPIGLNQDAVKMFLKEALKVQGHPSLGGVYIFDEKTKLWKLEKAPQAILVSNISRTIKEVYDWEYFPNNRFGSDISKAVKDYLLEVAPLYGENSPLTGDSRGSLIAFNNGTYDFKTNAVRETIADDFQTIKLPYDLIEPEPDEHLLANDWLEWIVGDGALTIKQLIGFALHRSYDHIGAYTIFINGQGISNGQNGKSQVLAFIDLLLGADGFHGHNPNTIDLALDQFTGDKGQFMTSHLRGKLANIKDDENDTFISQTAMLKTLSSGGVITADVKRQDPVTFRSQAKFFMGMNKIPAFRDDSEGMRSRMVIVPFNKYMGDPEEIKMFKGEDAPFNNDKRQKYIFDKEYLGKFAWECIQEFRKCYATHERNPFYISEQAQDMIDGVMINNDPLENFLNDRGYEITGDENDMVLADSILEDYESYAKSNARSINNLKQDLENKGVKTRKKNGKNANGSTKYTAIKRKFKDTDHFTQKVFLGIKKLEDE